MKSAIIFMLSAMVLFCCREADIKPTTPVDCTFADSSAQHPKDPLYREIIQRYIQKGLPGMSVWLEDSNGTWIGAAGYADLEEQIKFTPCHISKAASITKLLVGTLALMLQEEGKLNIDDPVSKYVSTDILKKIENGEGKTLRNLLTHTTGIFDVITSSKFYLAVINDPNKQWTQEELLKFTYGEKGVELGNPFAASYSNTNTVLLSMCIEAATGVPHDKLLREKIFAPLNMSNTFYQGREAIPTGTAQGYFDLHNNGTIANMSNFITGSGNGYGGIYSNVFDLNKFIRALFVNRTLLAQSSLDLMQQYIQEDTDFFTGAGTCMKFTGKPAFGVGHTGRDLGYSADLFYFPERGYTMIFFVNYGTNGDSFLKPVFLDFESEITDALLK